MIVTFFYIVGFLLMSYMMSGSEADERQPRRVSNGSCNWDSTAASNPSVFWINMEGSTTRRQYMEDQLRFLKFRSHRVVAVAPGSPTYNITKLQKPCKRNTDTDISLILSHLTAIHRAVYVEENEYGRRCDHVKKQNLRSNCSFQSDAKRSSQEPRISDYALITEDDVQFSYQLNFSALISSAPKDFGILQLSTSNEEALKLLWSTFKEKSATAKQNFTDLKPLEKEIFLRHYDKNLSAAGRLWTKNLWTSHTRDGRTILYWSTQAYLINKRVIKPFIDDVVHRNDDGSLSFKIINSFDPKHCRRTKQNPCVLANCLFSDTYIYSGGGPTYVTNIPLFTGAAVGLKSDMHQDQVDSHKKGFEKINNFMKKIRNGYNAVEFLEKTKSLRPKGYSVNSALLIPSFIINPRTCIPDGEMKTNALLL